MHRQRKFEWKRQTDRCRGGDKGRGTIPCYTADAGNKIFMADCDTTHHWLGKIVAVHIKIFLI